MKRLLLLLLLTSVLAAPLQAGPLDWVKRQFREHPTRTAFIVGGAAATVHGLGLRHCRQGSVENCQEKYGAAWQGFAWSTGINFAVIASTKNCWKEQSAKFCSLFAYGGSAAQLGFGIDQWMKKGPHEKVDSSLFALTRR